jgi:hypothetical protein
VVGCRGGLRVRKPGEPILLAPAPPGEELVLRAHRRLNHPEVDVATDVFAWWWLTPIVHESQAPMPARGFAHTAGILADLARRDPVAMGRN